MSKYRAETIAALARRGIPAHDAAVLIRASVTLHTWAEHECNGVIQRDEGTGKPYWYNPNTGRCNGRAQDRETGALKRALEIAARYGLLIYHQGDPRGCALYVYSQKDLDAYASRVYRPERRNEAAIESCYNSVGTAVIG